MLILIEKGDITTYDIDAIVNAANTSLLGGGGVDGAIHRVAGQSLQEECIAIRNTKGGCKTGDAVYTTGGNLLAKYVIHTVGPIWTTGNNNERELLRKCYMNSMEIANKLKCKTIAFPNISTGVYRFPKQLAVEIVYSTFNNKAFQIKYSNIEKIYFVNYDEENYRLYKGFFENITTASI